MARSFLIVGLGRFGKHMAKTLTQQGNEVLAIDINEDRVNASLKYVTDAQIGDATDPQFVEELGVNNFDVCIVAIGDNFQSSLESTCLLKEKGAKYVFARANRDIHKKFLLRNGADEVIYAERETAERFAIRFGSAGIFDYFKLSDEYAIFEVSVPESWIGKTIIEKNVRQKYNINVLALKFGTVFNALPSPDYRFTGEEKLLVMGTKENVKKMMK
ncbi:MAG: TrkA family potassium uptake protein [Ruminococcus sp.]|nr:TrkA family potassium uptake protein [Ruminococcus sp.]